MSAFEELGPFSDEPIDEVPLADAPLVRVLTQLRFPAAIAALKYGDGAAVIGRLVQPLTDLGYPLLEEGRQFGIQITPEGVTQVPGETLWSFRTADESWQMTLSPEFVTLHTGAYSGRDDFVERVKRVLEVLAPVVGSVGVSRVGFRYINQLQSVPPDEILALVRPSLHGGLAVPLGRAKRGNAMSEATFAFDSANGLQARWGALQPGVVLDPSLPAASEPSWVLDLDAFQQETLPFDPENLSERVRAMSERAYRFFRWSVTEAFLDKFGARR